MEMKVHLKEKALPGLYLQYLDISERHVICSICFWVKERIYRHIWDTVKAYIKKEHFFFLPFDLGHGFGTINI